MQARPCRKIGWGGSRNKCVLHRPFVKTTCRASVITVLVCGGRDYYDRATVRARLDTLHAMRPIGCVVTEGAAGADHWAENWAIDNGIDRRFFGADWDKHKRAAGPIRNKQMLVEGKPDLVLAFPGGKGTRDMIAQARRAGVQVFEVWT